MKTIHSGQHKKLVAKLVKARTEAGLLQWEAARLLTTSQSYLSKIESGQVRLDIIQLKKFAAMYHKPLEYFLEAPGVPFSSQGAPGFIVNVKSGVSLASPSSAPVSYDDAMICEMDRDATITYVSATARKLLGFSPEELIGTNAFSLTPKENISVRKKFVRDLSRRGQAFFQPECRLLNKQGEPVFFDIYGIPFFADNGKVAGFRGIYRKCADHPEKAGISTRYAMLVECAPFGIALVRDWKLEFTNLALQRISGYTPKEFSSIHLKYLFPDYLRDMIEQRHEARRNGEPMPNAYETSIQTKDGGIVDIELNIMPLRYSGSKEYVISVRDIGAIKNERDIFKRKQLQAEMASRVKTRYLAEMSHEIRTPLNALKGFSELLSSTKLDTVQREYMDIIRESADTLGLLLGDIIDISKIELGKMDLEAIALNLHEVAQSALKLARPGVEGKRLYLKLDMPENQQQDFYGDPTRIRQIITNLLSNALKFTSDGGITLSILTRKPVAIDGKYEVIITVTDTGIGIAPDKQQLIFEAFSQAEASTLRRFGGSGLGLAIVKMLAARMGGAVTLESKPGAGSKFSVNLFLSPAKPRALPAGTARLVLDSPAKPFQGARVLVAEDNAVNLKLVRILLENMGCVVDTVVNGMEAVVKARENSYGLIILDMLMPEMGGLAVAGALRGELQLKTPIIALTAAALQEDRDRALAGGIDGYLTKPVRPQDLEEKLAQYLYRKN